MDNDQPAKPVAFLAQELDLLSAVEPGARSPDDRLQDRDEQEEGAENPLQDRVDCLQSLRGRRHVAQLLGLQVVALSHVELEEGGVKEVEPGRQEAHLECKLEALRHVGVLGGDAGDVLSEGHHSVK